MIKEFREFIMRGNVMDLAVAVIIGGAFTAIINSLVNDIIMPLIGIILGGVDFTSLSITVGNAVVTYGNFIQAIINFLLIALVLFLLIRAILTSYQLVWRGTHVHLSSHHRLPHDHRGHSRAGYRRRGGLLR